MSKRKFLIEDFLNRDYPTPKERREAITELCLQLRISKAHFYRLRTALQNDPIRVDHEKLIVIRDFFRLRKMDDIIREPEIIES